MVSPNRGEVWLIDLGLAAKTRSCVVLSVLVRKLGTLSTEHLAEVVAAIRRWLDI